MSAAVKRAAKAAPMAGAMDVFINCPYDKEFLPYLDAIIFAVVCCGYQPQLADSAGDASTPRMERIFTKLRACGRSIHDLSLVHADEKTGVAHLNMPLELGIAMAITRYARQLAEGRRGAPAIGLDSPHDWLALVQTGAPYSQAISDLNGFDLKRYGSRETLVEGVFDWLTLSGDSPVVNLFPDDLIRLLAPLDRDLQALRGRRVGSTPWQLVVNCARQLAGQNGLIAAAAPQTPS